MHNHEKGRPMRKKGHGLSPRPHNWTVTSQLKHGIVLARAMSTITSSPNQSQERCKTVHVANECRPEREWPPFVTTTMELDETIGGRIPAVPHGR